MSFDSLGLSEPILEAIKKQGYDSPSPIQAKAIPAVVEGHDVMAAAQTGTGKTAGFTLPILERLSGGRSAASNQARALILTPTRELAAQVGASVETYGANLPLRSTVVFGGVKINPQMMKLRKGVDILVATPGRLLDLYNQKAVKFDHLEVLVLDEADRMLDMGFIHDIKKILRLLPKQRQNLLFSATFSNDIRNLAKGLVHNPVEISVSPPNTTVESIEHWIYSVDKNKKSPLLIELIKANQWPQVLVFSRTKHGANKLAKQLTGAGLNAAAIHGNKSQGARTRALAEFKSGEVQVLVATDIAARGLDIDQLPNVVNFDLPNVPEDYVHRIGRTGRAGASGMAVSLVCADEFKQLSDIERLIGELLPRKIAEGFEPVHALPESRLNTKPHKPKKPKKPKTGHRDGQRSGENAQGHKKDQRQGAGQQQKQGNGNARPANKRRRRRPASGNV
ncbi:DEAD/DEAH box helicase [Oceanicoccus sagamiensis]|uniref:ATP-dependent RNA helicase RhlE n=1 Tax=Oceanicoccus sagamiensis TaxID=716816 RepID=A0A1X9NC44_9GAMM|nr:DEAD/DEAH box helicase [Oceanicoccus sagamiensis]ARN74741.1 ATP-dependent RNA helicase [Oceanicoccus sagamiensis]